ncbi:Ni/Fe-hydrogenase, b-type cytochrome subunit [Sulfitobacter pacificus]|uniref:Ni/Fe-hydrogenase, b-type cytochrome subunit n=1 Tax=Sulfitobacter pacificus TaxID=1499314 RepID=UPI0031038610
MSVVEKHKEEAVYVYQAPIRIWHWIQAFSILALAGTGYLIGAPLPSVGGEAYDHYVMGYIRWIHFVAAYLVIIGFVFRIYWAFVGNSHAREIFAPPVWRPSFWGEVWHEIKWYAMLTKEPKKYVGHNPLAILTMHVLYVWGTIFMIFTGLALYGEGTGPGTWQHTWFTTWIIPLFGQSQDVHTWHHLGMWLIICFVIIHIYVAVREDIMSRQSIISSMISGWRTFKDDRPADD